MTQSLERIMKEVEINLYGLTGEVKSYELTPQQYEWLLLQASKAQEVRAFAVTAIKSSEIAHLHNQRYKEAMNKSFNIAKANVLSCPACSDVEVILNKALKGES